MKVEYVPGRIALDTEPSGTSQARLEGLALVFARGFWLASFIAALIIFALGIPAYVAYLHTISPSGVDIYAGQLTPGGLRSLHALGLSVDVYAAYLVGIKVLFVSVWLTVGAVIFWRKSDDRMALFASFTLVTFSVGFGFWIEAALPAWALPLRFMNFLSGLSIGIFSWVFPDGRFVPRWTRWPLIIVNVVHEVYSAFLAAPLAAFPLLSTLDGLIFVVGLVSIVVVQVYRYQRVSTAVQRQQTKWAVFGFAMAMTGFIIVIALGTLLSSSYLPGTLVYLGLSTFLYVSLLLVPLSIGLAILRSHLWDIDIIINRTLVYGLLTACIVGLYVFVVGYLGALFHTGGNLLISLIAAGLVAVAFQPLRAFLQRGVNRLLYGLRDEPYVVLAGLGQRLQATLDPDAVLSTIVETVREALKLSYAAIEVKEGATLVLVTSSGVAPAKEGLRMPLMHQQETVGTLIIAPRGRDNALTPADLRLLDDLADQIGIAVHAVRLTTDLQRMAADVQRSRERLVLAREEERRRLRRDLHDGLGPTLAALALTASNVTDLIPANPDAAVALANSLQNDIRATVGDIRRLVYELRPPALDELGLVAAIRERAVQFSSARGNGDGSGAAARLLVQVEAPQSLPPLAAAVEVAAYRIALEALTNVTRHAHASTCTIRLALTDALEIEITDDGIGLSQEHQAGVGLLSMRERAAELSGSCTIEKLHEVGTRVRACLPLSKE